jgi:hypothetical protein
MVAQRAARAWQDGDEYDALEADARDAEGHRLPVAEVLDLPNFGGYAASIEAANAEAATHEYDLFDLCAEHEPF